MLLHSLWNWRSNKKKFCNLFFFKLLWVILRDVFLETRQAAQHRETLEESTRRVKKEEENVKIETIEIDSIHKKYDEH